MRRTIAVLVLVLAGCATPTLPPATAPVVRATPIPVASPVASAAASAAPITVMGAKNAKTSKFHLAGDYLVTWTAQADDAIGCFQGGFLRRADGTTYGQDLGSGQWDGASPHSDTTHLYAVPEAEYYVEGVSGCKSWSYVFAPQ